MSERMMDFRGEVANDFLALGHLPDRDRVSAIRLRRRILDESECDNIRSETGILDVSQRLNNGVLCYLSRHERDYRR
jgi:hypothetical protein